MKKKNEVMKMNKLKTNWKQKQNEQNEKIKKLKQRTKENKQKVKLGKRNHVSVLGHRIYENKNQYINYFL